MSSRRAEGALAILVAIGSLGLTALAAGQAAQIINVQGGTAFGVSGGGDFIAGEANNADPEVRSNQGYRWTNGDSVFVGSLNTFFKGSIARGVSGDGKVVVGQTDKNSFAHQHAFRWVPNSGPMGGSIVSLVPMAYHDGQSAAHDVSDDGTIIVGQMETLRNGTLIPRAIRWKGSSAMDLNPDAPLSDRAGAYGVSADGSVIVGTYRQERTDRHAFRWSEETGFVDLGTHDGQFGVSHANAVSDDGKVVGGFTGQDMNDRVASLWKDGAWTQLDDMGSIFDSEVHDVSHNGRVAVGVIGFNAVIWDETGPHILKDYLQLHGADVSAWSGLSVAYGCSRDGRVIVGVGSSGSFRAYLPLPNIVPTVDPIAAKTIECVGDHNLITLETPVTDGDGDRLKVEWFVNGVVKQTIPNFAPGMATFQYDFPHGTTNVVVQVTDYKTPILQQATTVTVQDTTDPAIVVAPTQIVPTDKGVDYATKPNIPKPQVNEACDGAPVLTSDAPNILPIGTYTVTWTVKDFSGNVGTATQQIVVKDLEAPELLATPAVSRAVDRGEIFATINLPQPQVFDNVSAVGRIVVKSNARPRYPVGTTVVTWTATDEANNTGRATTTVTVVNRRPTADAGKKVTVNTTSEKGARVRLSAAKSSDPDGHSLKYVWSGRGAKFNSKKSRTPMGTFKVGVTNVKLTVIDEAGARHTDTVRVTVRLKNGKRRPRGAEANESFARASSAAAGSVQSNSSGDASVSGYSYAAAAEGYGLAAGEFVRWEEGQSEQDGLADYAALRYYQALYGERATNELIRAYGESGDDNALQAALEAARGVQAARADLSE